MAEGATNLYYTDARVRATVLTGLSTATASAILSTDTLLVALGKLQGQLNNVSVTELFSIDGTVASNALTITLSPCTLTFRSSSLTSGAINKRTVASVISLIVPAGATLGAISAQLTRLLVIAIDNAGTVELAVCNQYGGVNFNEEGVVSTVAITAGSTSNAQVYSTTARTGLPYKVVGLLEMTQATAGTYATAPSLKAGVGGQVLASLASIGYGQVWQNVIGSRALGTVYYNLTGKPIMVHVSGYSTVACTLQLTIDAVNLGSNASDLAAAIEAIVPNGGSYRFTIANGTPSIYRWAELR